MKTDTLENFSASKIARRSFLRYAGVGTASVGLLAIAACNKDSLSTSKKIGGVNGSSLSTAGHIDIGSGDIGILNFAFALEQLEAAFYAQVVATPFGGITDHQKKLFTQISQHEIIHREFFRKALGAKAIPDLIPDFSSINFNDRASVLKAAKAFEDTGVAAYDGVGYLIQNTDYLTIAGKIVSVEARHAAYIRNLLEKGDYAGSDVVDSNGLNDSMTIAQVLTIANTFLKTKVSASAYNYTA